MFPTMARTGIHLGLGEGYDKALAYAAQLGITTAQVFTHSPRSFSFKELDTTALAKLNAGWKTHGIHPVFSHCNYLINLGSVDNKTFYGSLATVKKELVYARAFGCDYFVLHVGKHKDAGLEAGMKQVVKGVDACKDELRSTNVMLLFETVAGQGTEIGRTFEELHTLMQMLDKDVQQCVGVAVDTCHIFAAGYDIRTAKGVEETVAAMERTFGVARVKLIHVNDSKGACGDHLDRHEHIGKGQIGIAGLKAFLTHPKIKDIPMVLETPIDDEGDQKSDLVALNGLLRQ
jgi:deoxyribonuclease-4